MSDEAETEGPTGRTILIVDDDRTTIDALTSEVRKFGHKVIAATSWTEALRLFRTRMPDLIMLDVVMPSVDGFKLAKMLKGQTKGFIPVILITGLDDVASKRRGMEAGADDFLTKPIDPVELEIRVQALLRIKDLTDEIERARRRLCELTKTDPLTKLHNRRALNEHLDREFSRWQRYSRSFSVLMIDIDNFKRIKDAHGRDVGDEVLMRVAAVLNATVRTTDFVGRWGGEEFLIVAPQTAYDEVPILAERLCRAVETECSAAEDELVVTVSVGVASIDRVNAPTGEYLVHLADECLYDAKRAGRNRCRFAHPTAAKGSGVRILVVDDDPTIQTFLRRVLKQRRESLIEIAENGVHALEVIEEKGAFDVMLVDLMMPKMDGIELMKRVRRLGPPGPAIVVLSAMPDAYDRALAAGADEFLQKPASPKQILQSISNALVRSRRRQLPSE